MSDLAATGCGNNDCGCGGNALGFFNGDNCCSIIWLIIIFSLLNNNYCGCNIGMHNGCGCDWIIILILFSCFCNNGNGCC